MGKTPPFKDFWRNKPNKRHNRNEDFYRKYAIKYEKDKKDDKKSSKNEE